MRFISLVVLVQSIWLCAARPTNLQPTTLITNAYEILNPQDVVGAFKDWFKPNSIVKVKTTDDSLCGDDSEKCDQCTGKPKTSLDKGGVSDSGKVDQKVNGTVSNDPNGDGKSKSKPDVKSNNTNDHKESLEWHDKICFRPHQFGKHKDIYRISQQNYAGFACPETESKMIKKDDNSTFISYQRWIYGAPYLYNVYWKDLCELENGKTEQDVTGPLEEGGCDNDRTGGSLQAGCLIYEFQARDKDQKPSFSPWMSGKGIPRPKSQDIERPGGTWEHHGITYGDGVASWGCGQRPRVLEREASGA
ncbi:hypothetical protein FAGAP_5587 [Fusarium agapanthi]|uniref:Uncharacterized protein n=1 Tax=Fusarium agapanthi TaxID=1803897 RepID=A0A9P5E711_9HYPO|nr:hypothetical protein FAGAP_5587 [Fusarium agapanthi]